MAWFKKKNKFEGQGTAIFIDSIGAPNIRIFKIISQNKDFTIIEFTKEEQYKIKQGSIRKNRIIIYKLANGKIIVQNPDKWKDIKLKDYNIKELRFNLQNYAIQEDKAARSRWTIPPDILTKLSPLFKLLIVGIVVGVIGWAAFKFGAYVLDVVMKSRIIDCAQILPKAQIPIGATNITAPIG